MTTKRSPRFRRPHLATIAAFSLMLVIGATTASAGGDRGHQKKGHGYSQKGHHNYGHSYRSYKKSYRGRHSGHARGHYSGHARGHYSGHDRRRGHSDTRSHSRRSYGYRGHGHYSGHGSYRSGHRYEGRSHQSSRYGGYSHQSRGYEHGHGYRDNRYKHHRRFSIPRLIGRALAHEFADYVLDRHYYRSHGHYHDVYRFPVYTDGHVTYRPYAYCEGDYFSVGNFRDDGTYYWD